MAKNRKIFLCGFCPGSIKIEPELLWVERGQDGDVVPICERCLWDLATTRGGYNRLAQDALREEYWSVHCS